MVLGLPVVHPAIAGAGAEVDEVASHPEAVGPGSHAREQAIDPEIRHRPLDRHQLVGGQRVLGEDHRVDVATFRRASDTIPSIRCRSTRSPGSNSKKPNPEGMVSSGPVTGLTRPAGAARPGRPAVSRQSPAAATTCPSQSRAGGHPHSSSHAMPGANDVKYDSIVGPSATAPP